MNVYVLTLIYDGSALEGNIAVEVFDTYEGAVKYALINIRSLMRIHELPCFRATMKGIQQHLEEGSFALYLHTAGPPDVLYRITEKVIKVKRKEREARK